MRLQHTHMRIAGKTTGDGGGARTRIWSPAATAVLAQLAGTAAATAAYSCCYRVTASRLLQLHSFLVPCARACALATALPVPFRIHRLKKRKRKKKASIFSDREEIRTACWTPHLFQPRTEPGCVTGRKAKRSKQQRARVELDPTPARCVGALLASKSPSERRRGSLPACVTV